MAAFRLTPNPERSPGTVTGVHADLHRDAARLHLTYRVLGAGILYPSPALPIRTDGLWRATCFELFLLGPDGRYVEYNFSPSTRWAAYALTGWRDGMTPLDGTPPVIERHPDGIAVACDLAGAPPGPLRLSLAAVIEETDGTKSWWALAHAPGPPDFHNPACFAATLPAPAAP